MADGICRTLDVWWSEVTHNADLVLKDPDPEHLHQMRVHLRRMRSLLARIKQDLPAKRTTAARKTLTRMMRRTGDLRDFDVLLDCRAQWMDILPPDMVEGGKQIWRHLKLERRRAHGLAEDYLQSRRYQDHCQAIDGYLPCVAERDPELLHAALGKAILGQYRKVNGAWPEVEAKGEPAGWHRLRIHLKKLRYCVEAAPSGSDRKRVLKDLKKAQDLLGEFNDLAVQQNLLAEISRQKWSAEAQQAMGAWRLWLHAQERKMMKNLAPALTAFCTPKTEARLKRLTS